MSAETGSHRPATVFVGVRPERERTPPSWFAEAIVLLKVAEQVGMRAALVEAVRVETGRMGRYEPVDFGLWLLLHVISGAPRLSETSEALFADAPALPGSPRRLRPYATVLPALWGREALPSRFALSRWLARVETPALEALRQAFVHDHHAHGLAATALSGCLDRTGALNLIFDTDGTVQTARQRSLVHDPSRPAPQRRREALMAKGYPGRKRADLIRTRLVVQHAHTHEWLGTFGHRGNTDLAANLAQATRAILASLTARSLPVGTGLSRLDGLYGHAAHLAPLAATGLGWLVRCVDYRLLSHPQLKAALRQQTPVRFESPDSGVVRQVFDGGFLSWEAAKGNDLAVRARIVLTLRDPLPTERDKLRIGRRLGGQVAELFATDRGSQAFTATDLLSLYLGRGGFERMLSEEDLQTDPDRLVSGHPHGQEFFQILCQWVDNLRLRLGHLATDGAPRMTLFADARPVRVEAPSVAVDPGWVVPVAPEVVAYVCAVAEPVEAFATSAEGETAGPERETAEATGVASGEVRPAVLWGQGQVALAHGRGSGRFGGTDFVWQPDGTLRCPAGQTLHRMAPRKARAIELYQAALRDCTSCALRPKCVGGRSRLTQGRRVTVWPQGTLNRTGDAPAPCALPVPEPPVPILPPVDDTGPEPVWWQDVAAVSLRRAFRRALHHQGVDLEWIPSDGVPPPAVAWQTRDQRAHRRLTYPQRLSRNASGSPGQWKVRVGGLPGRIADLLQPHDPPPH